MSDWIILFLAIFLFIVSVRLTIVQAELLKVENPDLDPESKPEPEPKPGKKKPSPSNDGDWMVRLTKPRKEIIVTGCETEGEVVRKIILMEYSPKSIKEIRQL